MKPKKCKKAVVNVTNSGYKETDGEYELRFYGNNKFTFCFLRHNKHFCNPVSGVAVVHPNDEPDDYIGCKIALVRAVESFIYTLPLEDRISIASSNRKNMDIDAFRGRLTTQLINAWTREEGLKRAEDIGKFVKYGLSLIDSSDWEGVK